MNSFLIVILIVVPCVLVFFLVIKTILSRVVNSMQDLVAVQFSEDDVVKKELMANFFGQESKGMGQVRGNGALVLTHDALCFFLAVPRRSWEIPLDSIQAVSLETSHLGKTRFTPLVKVVFDGDEGPDSIAWQVGDAEAWKSSIEEMLGQQGRND